MRLLCNGFHWLHAAAPIAMERHDVVVVDNDAILRMWARPEPDWWRAAAPAGWTPDVALIGCPEYQAVPPYLAELPCPVALWIGDWYINPEAANLLANQVDLVLADGMGVRKLRASGIDHVDELCPWTFDPALHQPEWEAEPEWDIGFVGNFNEAIQVERNRLLWRVARMDPRWRIRLCGGVYGEDYARFLRRSRITFNYSITGDVNMRCFEATACGSLVAINRSAAGAIGRWFEPGVEIVLYDESHPEEALERYLCDEDARSAVAHAGWERVQQYGPTNRMERLLDRLERLAAGERVIERPRDRARDGARAAAHLLLTWERAPLEGAEVLLDEGERADPCDASVQLNRAFICVRHAAENVEQASHAARWAEHYFARALQLDPTDATVWLACALFKESLGDHATRRITDHLIAEIRAGTLSARPDRSLPTVGITPRIIRWRRLILDSDDPGKALSELVLVNALELAARLEPIAARRIALLEEAATTVRDDPDTASALAEELILQDEFAEALPWLQLVHDRRPLSPNNWSLLVRTLLELRRVDEARALLEQCGAAAERLPVDPAVVALLYERLPA